MNRLDKSDDTKNIEYRCPECKHEWNVTYQLQMIPPISVKCPECKKSGNFQRVYNFFERQFNENS